MFTWRSGDVIRINPRPSIANVVVIPGIRLKLIAPEEKVHVEDGKCISHEVLTHIFIKTFRRPQLKDGFVVQLSARAQTCISQSYRIRHQLINLSELKCQMFLLL